MALLCPACGQESPDAASFCLACGTRLVDEGMGSRARKTITVLFSDLVGSTSLGEKLDTEVLTSGMSQYFDRMRRILRRHGGTVEKFIGDAIVAVFGYPTVREDDALRAVRAADEMRSELDALNTILAHELGVALQTRTGVHTGQVLVGALAPGSNFAAGDVMNTAARLQQMAAPDQILMGEATWHLVRDAVEAEPMEPVAMKGKTERVPAWRLVRALPGAEAFPRQFDSALVGRQTDLAFLTQAFHKTVQEGSVQLVTVVGEPGIGKSRLVQELRRLTDKEREPLTQWRQGRCLPYGDGITFWALGEIVKAQAGIQANDSAGVAAAKIAAVVPESSPEAAWLRQRLRPLVGLEASQAGRDENFAAWRRFLELLAEAAPSVFVFEDIHWADEALLAFLEDLADRAEGVPMLIVATTRPELFDRAPAWAAGVRNSRRTTLAPLSESDTATLTSNLFEQAALPEQLQLALMSRVGGNPLYAEEFVRLLKDRGGLPGQGPGGSIDFEGELALPLGVESLIAARLDTLPLDRKRLLQDAAVVGKVFWSGAVAAMGERNRWEVEAALHELSRKELVRPARPSSMEAHAEYSFSHDLVREVCYSQIPRAERAARHRRAAAWIEEVSGSRVEDHAEILAYHYGQAEQFLKASGDVESVRDLEERRLRFLVMAADQVLQLDALKAESLLRSALFKAPRGHPDRARLLVKLADADARMARNPVAEQALDEAIGEFEARGHHTEAAAARVRLADVLRDLGRVDEGTEVLRRALPVLEAGGRGPELARALVAMGRNFLFAYQMEDGLHWSRRALQLCRELGMKNEEARALQLVGIARYELGDVGSTDDLRESLRMSLDLGLDSAVTAMAFNNLADNLCRVGDLSGGVRIWEQGTEFAEIHGLQGSVMFMTYAGALNRAELGEWDEALAAFGKVLAWEGSKDTPHILVGTSNAKAEIAFSRGNVAEARRLQDECLPLARQVKEGDYLGPALAISALIAEALANRSEANALIREWAEATKTSPSTRVFGLLADAVRILAASGDFAFAADLIDETQKRAAGPRAAATMLMARATLAEWHGELLEAVSLYLDASKSWKEIGSVKSNGHALLGAGRCLVAESRAAEAEELLLQARDHFASLGARPALQETDNLLKQVAKLTSRDN